MDSLAHFSSPVLGSLNQQIFEVESNTPPTGQRGKSSGVPSSLTQQESSPLREYPGAQLTFPGIGGPSYLQRFTLSSITNDSYDPIAEFNINKPIDTDIKSNLPNYVNSAPIEISNDDGLVYTLVVAMVLEIILTL